MTTFIGKPISEAEFAIGMWQYQHNKDNPKHKCMCEKLSDMIDLHFKKHLEDKN